MTSLPPLAVSAGDPGGIGPDVILSAWERRREADLPAFYVIGDPALLATRARMLGVNCDIVETSPDRTHSDFARGLPVVALENRFSDAVGRPDVANAPGIIEAIDRAVKDTLAGQAAGLVTAPISKKPLYDAGFRYPGHTEYLGALAESHAGAAVMPVMMLAGPELRTVPVTIHIPLSAVMGALTTDLIIETCVIVDRDLRTRFGLERPRLAIAGLNPHAGEGGSLGTEDEDTVRPAIEELEARGLSVRGPLPADTMFHARARASHDVAICMYHDQALIPAKTLAFDDAVNVTLGLPFIRTSPDHGTAFDLAGSGQARPDSFMAAVRMAADMARHEARSHAR